MNKAIGSVPQKDETDYELRVDGLVERPKTCTLGELRALPQARVVHDVLCTDGWRVDRIPFEGVRLADLLDAAGVRHPGAAVRFTCFDGEYTESLTLEQARRSESRRGMCTGYVSRTWADRHHSRWLPRERSDD